MRARFPATAAAAVVAIGAIGAIIACGERVPRPQDLAIDVPVETPPDQTRDYTIWLGGARIGTATERETWTVDGVTLRRRESLHFLRGDAPVAMTTEIEIVADRALVPRRVTWTERGAASRRGEAVHAPDGWRVTLAGAVVRVPADAIPAELVPLVVRRDGHFAGDVFLPARQFVAGAGRIDPVAPGRLVARLALAGGAIAEATIDLDPDGTPARVVDGDGVIAMRTSAANAALPFPAVDLVAATAIPITGDRPRRPRMPILELRGDLVSPPLPGQAARPSATGLELTLAADLPGDLPPGALGPDRSRDIAALVARVQRQIAPDLSAAPTSARDADDARAGDCTTYALAYAALATRADIPTRIVTGLRVDGARLVRHRWAISWTGHAWIAVDAAFGAAPAGGDLVGLAVHDADDAGLVAGEAALHDVTAAAWVEPSR